MELIAKHQAKSNILVRMIHRLHELGLHHFFQLQMAAFKYLQITALTLLEDLECSAFSLQEPDVEKMFFLF